MMVLEGDSALSSFRRERLQARLQAVHSELRLIGAWWTYWVVPEADAQPDGTTLSRILQGGFEEAPRAAGAPPEPYP